MDSNPILDLPPSSINLILFPNSSLTSSLETGLIFVEIFALGAARGYFKSLRSFWVNLFFGNLTATVFLLFVTIFEIWLSFLSFKTNVIGPGQSFLYKIKKFFQIIITLIH